MKKKKKRCAKRRNPYKFILLPSIFNTDVRFALLAKDFEREVLEIRLNLGIVEPATNKTFCIEDIKY